MKDYAVFFRDSDGPVERILKYHVSTGKLDSTGDRVPNIGAPAAVSADGKRLYLNSGKVVDAETLEMLHDSPYRGFVAVSPDNQLVALCDTDLFIVRASDYALVFHDTDATTGATFSANSRRFYAKKPTVGACAAMYVLDLEHDNQVTRRCIKGGMGSRTLVVSPDETTLYLYKHRGGYFHSFDEYDLTLDSAVFTYWFEPGSGSLAQTPDGKDVYFTAPGELIVQEDPPPLFSLAVYHTETRTIDMFVRFQPMCGSDSPVWPSLYNDIVITPDGRWVVGTGREMVSILRLDLRDGTQTVLCFPGRWLTTPKIQNGL